MTITTVNEAGRKGGFSVLQNRGRSFYVDIGRKGQLALRLKYPNMASKWGKLGGRPRKPSLIQLVGENSK